MEQLLTVIKLGLSTLPARRGAALVVVVGMACAIGAMVSVQSLNQGLLGVIDMGRADRAIILSKGSEGEFNSAISQTDSALIAETPASQERRMDGPPPRRKAWPMPPFPKNPMASTPSSPCAGSDRKGWRFSPT